MEYKCRAVRERILGAPVDVLEERTAIKLIEERLCSEGRVSPIYAVNPEKVYALKNNQELLGQFNKAFMLIPDGIGVVLALRRAGYKASRVAGADLMISICELAAREGYGVYVFGASEEVNKSSVEKLVERFPGLRVCGRRNGYIEEMEMPELVEDINNSRADILFIALGSPRQEQWVSRFSDKLRTVKLCQGVGGTLDTIDGRVRRAPKFAQDLGVEWLFRLLMQPVRIRRQIVLLKFFFEAIVFENKNNDRGR